MVVGFTRMSSKEQADVIEAHIRKNASLAYQFEKSVDKFIRWNLPDIAGKESRQWSTWLERNSPLLRNHLEMLLAKFFGAMRTQDPYRLAMGDIV